MGERAMALSAFDDKSSAPDESELASVLGRARTLWDRLIASLGSEYAPVAQAWKFSGQQWGWSLQLKQRKRTIVYLTPRRGQFIAGFAFGEKAVKAAHQAHLSDAVLEVIDGAQKYAEGRAVRLEVRTKKDLRVVEQVVAVKMTT
jgi:hypothetical protein